MWSNSSKSSGRRRFTIICRCMKLAKESYSVETSRFLARRRHRTAKRKLQASSGLKQRRCSEAISLSRAHTVSLRRHSTSSAGVARPQHRVHRTAGRKPKLKCESTQVLTPSLRARTCPSSRIMGRPIKIRLIICKQCRNSG